MTRFAVVAPAFTSHVRALEALSDALVERGHQVDWVQQADARALLRSQHIGFHAVGARSHPRGSLAATVARAARPGGPRGLRRVIDDVAAATDMLCAEAPGVLRGLRTEAVIADQMEAAGGLVAEHLGLPCVSVACALPVNREPRLPLPVMPWGYGADERGLRINEGSTRVYDWMMRPHARVIAARAASFGLAPRERLDQCLSPLLQLSQTVEAFDFPRESPPPHFHAVGPLRPPEAVEPELAPWVPGLREDRPFVFASLGTLQGGRAGLFGRIARACRARGAQLLLAHCGALNARQAEALRRQGATWVTDFAPQRAAIARADAVVTHAGLNTVMDALAAARPMLLLPIAFDQPGAAARVAHAGAGLACLPAFAGAGRIARTLGRLLDEPAFAAAAAALAPAVRGAGGTARAVDLIEDALRRAGMAAASTPPGSADAASHGCGRGEPDRAGAVPVAQAGAAMRVGARTDPFSARSPDAC
jgi:zeaxanthin glucosyltransferase